jgi:hypothetical protein
MRSQFERPLKNSLADIQYFATHPMFAQELKKSNPALYKSLRDEWQAQPKGPAPSAHDRGKAIRENWDKQVRPRTHSPEELGARGRWSQADVMATSAADALKLKEANAAAYYELELARSSYGLPSSRSVEENLDRLRNATRTPNTNTEPDTYAVSREMIEKLGFKSGERISRETFNNAISTLVRLEDEEKARAISERAKQIIEQEDAAKQ